MPVISGQDGASFSLVNTDWPVTLEPGDGVDVVLVFAPAASGIATAEIEVSAALSGGLSGGVDASAFGNLSIAVALLGQGQSQSTGDDDDSAGGDDDDTSAGDDDDTSAGDDDDTSVGDDDSEAGEDSDGDGFADQADGGTDCDDSDPTVNPSSYEICDGFDNDCDGDIDDDPIDGSTWHLDSDSDGYGGQLLTQEACTAPASYVENADDCDDLETSVYPGATELCNGVDDDCDGEVDDNAPAAQTWYLDNDGDGVGGFWLTQEACSMPQGYAGDSSDCDDTNAAIYAQAPELCDGDDNDCDGNLGGDEIDDDGDGVTECSLDCDDADPLRFPGSAELCDGIDNDCDPATTAVGDELDADSDTSLSCEDCDDDPVTGPAVYPGADEVCDGVDNDCDGTTDVGASDETTWYFDADGDTYGGFLLTQQACSAPTGYVASSTDCAELDLNSYPGAPEICDGVDNDCNTFVDDGTGATGTVWYADSDADGYGDQGTMSTACSQPTGYVSNDLDCDDGSAATNPTSYEICDGVDNNCVDGIDEPGALDADDWYIDADGDGYGVVGVSVAACDQPTGYADNFADCDDDPNNGGAAIHPNAAEICNSTDDDCDGTIDVGAVGATIWYVDADGDGYGSPGTGTLACSGGSGQAQNDSDCEDDANNGAAINPAATELCNDIDDDCDTFVDEDDALGVESDCPAETCKQILDTHATTPGDGTYWVSPGNVAPFQAYCDMGDGGWTYASAGSPFLISFSGAVHTLTVPDLDTEYEFNLYGASDGGGQDNGPQQGGQATGRKVFTAGSQIHVYVGGQGAAGGVADQGNCDTQTGGFNGGGRGTRGGSGGGGATDIRTTLGNLSTRLLVAGGAGGCGYGSGTGCQSQGGDGGGLQGDSGSTSQEGSGGGGGTQSAGGVSPHNPAANGSFGQGGNNVQCNDEAGGGGGWYGGAAGGTSNTTGGGGSSYLGGMDSDTSTTTGVNTGDGYAEYVFR